MSVYIVFIIYILNANMILCMVYAGLRPHTINYGQLRVFRNWWRHQFKLIVYLLICLR